MSALSRSVLTGEDTADAVVARVRELFAQEAVALLRRSPGGWEPVAATGPCEVSTATTQAQIDDTHQLVLRGAPLPAGERRVLEAFATQAGLVLEYRRLREREEQAAALESAESTSTALLRAVSHDLRTPLATMRAGIDGLVAAGTPGVEVAAEDRVALVEAVAGSTDQLEHLIDDLLDLSRVQTGLVRPLLADRSLEEVLPLAVAGHPPGAVELELDESAPVVVHTDAVLLERVIANLVANGVRASAGRTPVRILVHPQSDAVALLVVDQGPGVPLEQRRRMFEPFQRLADAGPDGLGLGLAVAQGLTTALGGTLEAEDTPGGRLTMVVTVPAGGER